MGPCSMPSTIHTSCTPLSSTMSSGTAAATTDHHSRGPHNSQPGTNVIYIDHMKVFEKYGGDVRAQAQRLIVSDRPTLSLFYGFSGPTQRQGSFADWAKIVGYLVGFNVSVVMADILNDVDLADNTIWHQHRVQLGPGGSYHGSLWSPPCSTFSKARRHGDGGPPPLRGASGADLLGLPDIRPEDKEKLRLGTLLAVRTGEGIGAQGDADKPWLLENPPEVPEQPSLFNVPQVAEQLEKQQAHKRVIPQCSLGAEAVKMTEFRSKFKIPVDTAQRCTHPRRWMRLPPSGRWIRVSHPPLVGKHLAVSPETWDSLTHEQRVKPEAEFLTRQAAAYPSLLNCFLACLLIPQAMAAKAASTFHRTGEWRNVLVRQPTPPGIVRDSWAEGLDDRKRSIDKEGGLLDDICRPKRLPEMTDSLRPQAAAKKVLENQQAVGGMRRPQWSNSRIPSLGDFGNKVRNFLDEFLNQHPELENQCIKDIGKDVENPGPSEECLDEARHLFGDLVGVKDIGPIKQGDFSTEIRANLLEGWRNLANDPDWAVTSWLCGDGVPSGLRRQPEDCGIFPKMDDESDAETMDMTDNVDDFEPYASVENDEDAWSEVMRIVDKGWLKQLPNIEEVTRYLGERPVLSKFGLIVKVRHGKTKKRLILDGKSLGVSSRASKGQRIILPRLLDVVYDALNLLATGKRVTFLVLDFADAFFRWHGTSGNGS